MAKTRPYQEHSSSFQSASSSAPKHGKRPSRATNHRIKIAIACIGFLSGWVVCALMFIFVLHYRPQVANDTTSAQPTAAPGVVQAPTAGETAAGEAPTSDNKDVSTSDQTSDSSKANDASQDEDAKKSDKDTKPSAEELRKKLNLHEDYRKDFVHGDKSDKYQKYIVMHDTETNASAENIIDGWEGNGNLVAAHFIVNRDGSVWQCVPMDKIAHHVGFGDNGHNQKYDVTDESRDDKKGTKSIGSWAKDYGMNSYSIGIEMVHVGSEEYPKAQLEAVDNLIAYIDAYYGSQSKIIDHKAWRTGNSDTSSIFKPYLNNLQQTRTTEGAAKK